MKKQLNDILIVLVPLAMLAGATALFLMPPENFPVTRWYHRIPYHDKLVHFAFYFLMVTAVRFARTYFGKWDKWCPWKLLAVAALYGGAIELLQGQYFGRGCDLWDEVANVLGAIVAIWIIPQSWHQRLSDKFGGRKTSANQP